MSNSICHALGALALGECAIIHGVRVTRRSLFGFQLGARSGLLEAAEAAARIAAAAKAPAARVELCFRCGGDGLGRRNRGVCGVCHGRGAHVVEPAAGWAGARPDELAAALAQTVSAMRAARPARARETLAALLAAVLPLAPAAVRVRAFGDLRRCGLAAEAEALSEAASAA
jgi:hypothetical protein